MVLYLQVQDVVQDVSSSSLCSVSAGARALSCLDHKIMHLRVYIQEQA